MHCQIWKTDSYSPIVLENQLSDNYKHFLLFKFGLTVLLSKNLNAKYNDYANELLRLFVKHSIKIYGAEFCVFNVHSLIHLAADARTSGSLETVSAFPFENYLGFLKKCLENLICLYSKLLKE